MAGLTREGFTPLSYQEVVGRISSKLVAFNPTIDLSTESPDGQLVEIFSFEVAQAWNELSLVYNSYNPDVAIGAGLRNIGLITGLPYGAATRSQAVVNLVGVAGTIVPRNSVVSDGTNEFTTSFDAVIPASVQAVAKVSGGTPVGVGAINTIVSVISGWTSVTQTEAGRQGGQAQTETQFRNLRNKTVLRNFVSVDEVIRARLFESLGIEQVDIVNNDTLLVAPDGTPPQTIHVTVGEIDASVTDEAIAQVILATKGLACPTHGTTSVTINDTQGNPKVINFTKATPVSVFMNIEVLFLDANFAGEEELIKKDLINHINSLDANENVIWSRLFGLVTPHAKAQVNVLELSKDGVNYSPTNVPINTNEFATTNAGLINLTVVN